MIPYFAAIQLFGIGILGEYIGRLFEETKRRPPYLVDAMINFPDQVRLLFPARAQPERTSL